MRLIGFTLTWILFCDLAYAISTVRYVADILYVPIRTGSSNGHKIIRTLKSGDRVEIIVDDANSGYTKVRTPQGEVGWIKTRYMLNDPIARDQLAHIKGKYNLMVGNQKKLTETIRELRGKLTEVQSKNKILTNKSNNVSQELERISSLSGNVISISSENQRLKQEKEKLLNNIKELTSTNVKLHSNSRNEGIKLGIGAVAFGIIIGTILPFLKPRRRKETNLGIRLR